MSRAGFYCISEYLLSNFGSKQNSAMKPFFRSDEFEHFLDFILFVFSLEPALNSIFLIIFFFYSFHYRAKHGGDVQPFTCVQYFNHIYII